MYNNLYGARYDANLPLKDIAKMVKKEASKKYPDCKISATTKNFHSIWIKIMLDEEKYRAKTVDEVPKGPEYWNIERQIGNDGIIKKEELEEYIKNNVVKSTRALDIERDVKDMLGSYNYDKSDVYTDYFDCNFYGSVNVIFQ